MTARTAIPLISTGIRNMDELLGGGLPSGGMTIISGPPGSGKTTLAHQICFHNASAETKCIYFNTLSEPTAKNLKYQSQFDFFDAEKIGSCMEFVDLGGLVKSLKIQDAIDVIMQHVTRVKPKLLVIDSFRIFDDLALSRDELRKFGYQITVNLMAWEATVFFVGEYSAEEQDTRPLFSIADGVITTSQLRTAGEQQRFVQVVKMRGMAHARDAYPFSISAAGIEVYAPRATLRRKIESDQTPKEPCKTYISRFDELIGRGIPWGSSLLVAGVAGTGKTVTSLEFIYRGALRGERGIVFSFEETTDRLLAAARGLGWNLDEQVRRGLVEMHFIPQPDILVEQHLLFMEDRVKSHRAQRVMVDSLSVFLHKIEDPRVAREKTFQVATVIQNAAAVGFLATDVPYGMQQISRFGVEETVVDGVVLLSSTEEGMQRHRYVEIYKLRNTSHLQGRHSMVIGRTGIEVYPRYADSDLVTADPMLALGGGRRLPSGVPGLDELLGGGLIARSATLLSGSAGIGKSTMALQFALARASRRNKSLFISFEETPEQIVHNAAGVGLPLREAIEQGAVEAVYLPGSQVLPGQMPTLLTERLRASRARRVVLDGVTHIARESVGEGELQQLLCALVHRFKRLGATSLLTLESPALFSMEATTHRDVSAIADNLILLRYARGDDTVESLISIVKTRGSAHDRGTHAIRVRKGGLHVEPRRKAPGHG